MPSEKHLYMVHLYNHCLTLYQNSMNSPSVHNPAILQSGWAITWPRKRSVALRYLTAGTAASLQNNTVIKWSISNHLQFHLLSKSRVRRWSFAINTAWVHWWPHTDSTWWWHTYTCAQHTMSL